MFTGLIEGIGRVTEVVPGQGSTRITIASTLPADGLEPGASVAVDGVCLTVASRGTDRFSADAVAETLARTTLSGVREDLRVHLERSLRLGDRLGGHLVAGHVDATVPVVSVERRGDDRRLRLGLPPGLGRLVAEKGSVALHGVSLTVARVDPEGFEVVLVPQTLIRTTLGEARVGDRLNLEVDLLARYLERLLGDRGSPPGAGATEP